MNFVAPNMNFMAPNNELHVAAVLLTHNWKIWPFLFCKGNTANICSKLCKPCLVYVDGSITVGGGGKSKEHDSCLRKLAISHTLLWSIGSMTPSLWPLSDRFPNYQNYTVVREWQVNNAAACKVSIDVFYRTDPGLQDGMHVLDL